VQLCNIKTTATPVQHGGRELMEVVKPCYYKLSCTVPAGSVPCSFFAPVSCTVGTTQFGFSEEDGISEEPGAYCPLPPYID
jgi:hypothetical protein